MIFAILIGGGGFFLVMYLFFGAFGVFESAVPKDAKGGTPDWVYGVGIAFFFIIIIGGILAMAAAGNS